MGAWGRARPGRPVALTFARVKPNMICGLTSCEWSLSSRVDAGHGNRHTVHQQMRVFEEKHPDVVTQKQGASGPSVLPCDFGAYLLRAERADGSDGEQHRHDAEDDD
eukprot:6202067-Pleurochrysis_carterae.AAC.1